MQHQKLLGSLLLLTLIFTFSSSVYASEVTGSLSSTGASKDTTAQNTSTSGAGGGVSNNSNSTNSNTVMGAMITTQGGTKSLSGTTANNASAKTTGADSSRVASSPSPSNLSSDGLALQSTSYVPAQDNDGDSSPIATNETSANSLDDAAYNYLSSQVATPLGVFREFSSGSWFWITLLGLLLLGTITYIYGKPREESYNF